MFAIWFASGMVLMYVPFPSLPETARLSNSATIDLAKIELSPAQIIAKAGFEPERLRLVQYAHEPAYLLQDANGINKLISATTGAALPQLTPDEAREISAHFAQKPASQVSGPFDYDQWIVHQRFDPERPFYRVDIADNLGTELYVSAKTGQVLQRTTEFERLWNWVGAVTHWIYPTILRSSFAAWNQVVWWLALVALIATISGIAVGIARSITFSLRDPIALTKYRGWMRWHHVLGMIFGLVVLNWIFSGWLSMDHGRLFPSGNATEEEIHLFEGMALSQSARLVSVEELRHLGTTSEIELTAVGGNSFLIVRGSVPPQVFSLDSQNQSLGTGFSNMPTPLIQHAVQTAWTGHDVIYSGTGIDDIYSRSESLTATTERFLIQDNDAKWVHVDASSGQIISVMSANRRVYSWIYYGLHTFDFPFFSSHPILKQLIMIPVLLGGFIFSITGAVLGLNRIFTKLW